MQNSRNERIKICIVAPVSGSIGGISTWFHIIKNESSNHVEIFEIDTSLKNNLYKRGFNLKRKVSQFFRIIGQKRQLIQYIKRYNISVLHIATSGGYGFLRDFQLLKVAKKYNLKTILHLHYGKFGDEYSSKGYISKICNNSCKLADLIICIDQDTKSFLDEHNINSKLIFNPVKVTKNKYNPQSNQFLFLGNVISTKGVFELLTAFEQFNHKKEFMLKIIGPIDDNFKEHFKNNFYKNVCVIGPLSHEESMKELSRSRVLILPSYSEGMPYSILESMARSVPVIGTSVGNIPSMIGDCGILIKPKSIEDIISSFNMVCDINLCKKLSELSFKKASSSFSSDVIINDLICLWGTK